MCSGTLVPAAAISARPYGRVVVRSSQEHREVRERENSTGLERALRRPNSTGIGAWLQSVHGPRELPEADSLPFVKLPALLCGLPLFTVSMP